MSRKKHSNVLPEVFNRQAPTLSDLQRAGKSVVSNEPVADFYGHKQPLRLPCGPLIEPNEAGEKFTGDIIFRNADGTPRAIARYENGFPHSPNGLPAFAEAARGGDIDYYEHNRFYATFCDNTWLLSDKVGSVSRVAVQKFKAMRAIKPR